MTLRRPGAMSESEVRTQGAFVPGGYGRDRGRRLGPDSAAGRHKASFRDEFLVLDDREAELYLDAHAIAERVGELGAELARDYAGRDPILVAALRASTVFLADLSRAVTIPHVIDFVELERYRPNTNGSRTIRLLKDLDVSITGRDVVIVEDVVDTGLTLRFLCNSLVLRDPRSLAVATLLDRPYRRLVDDLPVRYVGFVAPDELFVGYGFDLHGRYRALPELYFLRARG